MQEINHKKSKVYYSMGEVAEMFDVNPSLLRYWEQEFDVLKPHRNKKGNRLFTPQDVDNVKIIYHLLKERKMKIEVARKYIKDSRREVDRDAEIAERLMSIRAILLEIKQDLTYDGEVVDNGEDDMLSEAEFPKRASKPAETAKKSAAGRKKSAKEASSSPQSECDDAACLETIAAEGDDNNLEIAVDRTGEACMSDLDIVQSEALLVPAVKLPFEEQVLFEVAVPLEMLQSEVAISPDTGYESARSAFAGEAPQSEAEETPAEEKPRIQVIEQTLF